MSLAGVVASVRVQDVLDESGVRLDVLGRIEGIELHPQAPRVPLQRRSRWPPQVEVLDSSCCSTTRSGEAGQHVERERRVTHAFHRAAGVAELASVALGEVGDELHHV